jgi:hypothetical protein
MYRIRLASGEEAVYKTVEELAQAVASGMISPTAEVFHKAGNRWLPINTHPDYRTLVSSKQKAVGASPDQESPAPEGAEASSTPTRKSQAIQFESVIPVTVPVRPLPQPFAEVEAAPPIILDPVLPPEGSAEFLDVLPPGFQRPRRPIAAMVLGITSLLLAAGIAAELLTKPLGQEEAAAAVPPEAEGMAPAPGPVASTDTASAEKTPPTPPVGAPARGPSPRPGPETPKATLARSDTGPVVYPAPSKPLAPANKPAPRTAAPPPPPRVVSRLGTTVNKMPSYYEAYADARADMDESLAYVDFRRVFAPTRFASADSIRAARRMVAAAGNILRVYRGREVMLEQTYRPGEPEGKGSLRETFEVAEASRGLLAEVDSLFAVLMAQGSEVRYRDNTLFFQNKRAGEAYSGIRRRILQTLSYLGDPAEAADRVTMPRLLRGFGADRPPPAR